MLVLSRQKDQSILIGDSIRVMVVDVRGDKVRLGIEAPKDVAVDRVEVRQRKDSKRGLAGADAEWELYQDDQVLLDKMRDEEEIGDS